MNKHLKKGKEIFEKIPKEQSPYWGLLILSFFKNCLKEEPNEITDLRKLIQSKDWKKAHNQFSKIRELTLKNTDIQKELYLSLSENIAKITYNAWSERARFDVDSGHWIYGLALRYAESINSKEKINEIIGLLNLFQEDPIENNFFGKETKNSGNDLLERIFNSQKIEMIELKNEFPRNCKRNEITLKNGVCRVYTHDGIFPNGSFEFLYDMKFCETNIGYYSLIWDYEINLIDEYLVLE